MSRVRDDLISILDKRLAKVFFMSLDNSHGSLYDSAKLYTSGLDDLYKKKSGNGNSVDVSHLHERLRELESERKELGLYLHFLKIIFLFQ